MPRSRVSENRRVTNFRAFSPKSAFFLMLIAMFHILLDTEDLFVIDLGSLTILPAVRDTNES